MPLVQGRKRRSQAADNDDIESPDGSPEPQTQRRRTQNESDDEEYGGGGGTTQSETLDEMSKKLVRLALACEFQRKPIRRADISEKVLGPNGRQFKQVWAKAQMDLEVVFGMRMVELPAREKLTMQQKRAAQKSASQAKSGPTSWQLVSTLPPEFRDPNIIQPLAAPTAEDEAAYTGIYTMLVTFIRLSGGALPDVKMDRYLKKLGMEDKTPVIGCEDTPKLMKRLERDGYIIRIKESTGTGEDDIYWVIGPRGKVEVSDESIRGFIGRVYGDMRDPEPTEELERKIQRSLGIADQVQAQGQNTQAAKEKPKKRAPKKKKSNEESESGEEEDEEDEDDDEAD